MSHPKITKNTVEIKRDTKKCLGQYFGGGLIMLRPNKKLKKKIETRGYSLARIVEYFNSDEFKNNFTCSGRFRIGHRQISNFYIPKKYL
jgi:hypothetical protein